MMSVCGKQWGMCGKCGGGVGVKKKNHPPPHQDHPNKPQENKKKK